MGFLITQGNDHKLRQPALTSGWGLLIMTLFTLYPYYYIFPDLIILDDAAATSNNIVAHELQFRVAICCYLMVVILDVLVAWSLYAFFAPVSKSLSLLSAWFRLVYATIFGLAISNYFGVLRLLLDENQLSLWPTGQLQTEAMLYIKAFDDMWAIGFVFFGLHLCLLGYLAFKSGYIPKFFGIILTLAGLSYLIDYFSRFLFPEAYLPVSTYFGWGELIFMFWLLFKGGLMELEVPR
ncbi:unnamed protein product [Ectocarpus sp. 13 AM-2016]